METEMKNSMDGKTITKETTTWLSKYISNTINNDTVENQDTLIASDFLVIGPLRNASKLDN